MELYTIKCHTLVNEALEDEKAYQLVLQLCESYELFENIKMPEAFTKAQTCTILVQMLRTLVLFACVWPSSLRL
jgi:hypothetical protein